MTGIGAARELPEFVEKVSLDVTADELASVLDELLGDRSRRHAMAAAGISYAGEHDFSHAADLVLAVAEVTEAG